MNEDLFGREAMLGLVNVALPTSVVEELYLGEIIKVNADGTVPFENWMGSKVEKAVEVQSLLKVKKYQSTAYNKKMLSARNTKNIEIQSTTTLAVTAKVTET